MPPSPSSSSSSSYLRLGVAMVKLAFLADLFSTHVFSVSAAAGPSMLPTLALAGDWLALDHRFRHGRRRLAVGDLVLYRLPYANYARGVKRVIGLPGDYVSVGVASPHQPGHEHMIQVPQGHCWIVGDNLTASRDSRTFGPVPLALIEAKVVAKILPWEERKWIENGLHPVTE